MIKLERLQQLRKIVIAGVLLAMLLLHILPMGWSFGIIDTPNGYQEVWDTNYMFEDEILRIFVFPFYFIFPIMLLTELRWVEISFKIIAGLVGGIYLIYGMGTGALSQDYTVGYGTLALISIPVLLALLFYLDWVISKKTRS